MKILKITAITLSFLAIQAFTHHSAEKYSSNTGNITFFSHTDVEDIKAENHKVKSVFLSSSGKIQFLVNIKDFVFPKALMQEHFNENYMESDEFPRSSFDGMIEDIAKINFGKDGTYTSNVKGKLTIKDVTKEVSTTATFTVKGENVNGKAKFNVNPEDYNIDIPDVVRDKIAKELEITVDIDYSHSH